MPAMPTTTQVVPGALVNIVLKADQPTGRTIQGTVSQLLTRGNHPRGIKVRLTDGSVGRVQSMAGTTAGVAAAAEYPTQAAGNTQSAGQAGPANTSNSGRIRYHDVRTDQEQPPSTQPIGLDAYIKPAKKRGRAKKAATATADTAADDRSHGLPVYSDQPSPAPQESVCPVCGDFRGDGPALTHHVQSHFA